MEADWDEVCSTKHAARSRQQCIYSRCELILVVASNRSAEPTGTSSSRHPHLDLRIRHDAGITVDRQQSSEYVRRLESAYATAYARQGRVTSLYGPQLERYTSYRGHAASEGPVKQFLFTDKGVLSISRQSVHYSHRRGLTQWHLTYVGNRDRA
jgi:hypothetical protein